MTIIESFLQGKHTNQDCEDGLVLATHFLGVIDGSTSKTPRRIHPQMNNGRYTMLVLQEVIQQMPAQVTLDEFIQQLTETLRCIYLREALDLKRLAEWPTERLTCSLAVLSLHHQQLWLIGDCQALVDGRLYCYSKPYEDELAKRRASYIRRALAEGAPKDIFMQKTDPGRALILNDLIQACREQNVSYAVLDGFPVCRTDVHVVDVSGAHEIVIATDGYPQLFPSLRESEDYLARMLRDDPLCIHHHPATKGLLVGNRSFDDRAYLRIQL